MPTSVATYDVQIAGVERSIPIVPLPNGPSVAYLKLLGDTELLRAVGSSMAERLPAGTEVIVGPEAGGIVIAHQLSLASGLPYVIVRKRLTPDMAEPILTEDVRTSGNTKAQQLVLGEEDSRLLRGRKVVLVDEVMTSGATIGALDRLARRAGAQVSGTFVVATQGEERPDILSLCHLPAYN